MTRVYTDRRRKNMWVGYLGCMFRTKIETIWSVVCGTRPRAQGPATHLSRHLELVGRWEVFSLERKSGGCCDPWDFHKFFFFWQVDGFCCFRGGFWVVFGFFCFVPGAFQHLLVGLLLMWLIGSFWRLRWTMFFAFDGIHWGVVFWPTLMSTKVACFDTRKKRKNMLQRVWRPCTGLQRFYGFWRPISCCNRKVFTAFLLQQVWIFKAQVAPTGF